MIYVGLAFLVVWLLFVVFSVSLAHSLLATAIIFMVIGFLTGERPFINRS